jgi:hypothetical protein
MGKLQWKQFLLQIETNIYQMTDEQRNEFMATCYIASAIVKTPDLIQERVQQITPKEVILSSSGWEALKEQAE